MRPNFWKLILILIPFYGACYGQVDQTVYDPHLGFYFQVKQIDDFIDRFNLNPNGSFYQYLIQKHPEELKRKKRNDFIKSLFNAQQNETKPELITSFINEVVQKKIYINTSDKDWFALLKCDFDRKGKKLDITLSLELETSDDGSSKWVICGVLSDSLNPLRNVDTTKYLNPSSHGTDFIGIERIFKDKTNLPAYIAQNYRPSTLTTFIQEIKNGTLKFVSISDISYHFLQVPGWIFIVNHFQRDSSNSGWLIAKLYRDTYQEKDYYRFKYLGIK